MILGWESLGVGAQLILAGSRWGSVGGQMMLAWESLGVRGQMMLGWESLGVRSSNHIDNGPVVL